ncbi:MAG: spore germination protein [Firmicutes bacterium HGW-Firmicutes-14]|nr:MAG: spore germination protein [Firmicutes bacterium HGW-Firmicutes-14]
MMKNFWSRFKKKTYLSFSLEENLQIMRRILFNCMDVVYREFYIDRYIRAVLVYAEGLADKALINSDILKSLMLQSQDKKLTGSLVDAVKTIILPFAEVKNVTEIEKIINSVLSGDSILLIENCDQALIIGTRGWEHRAITEPSTETVIRGPREAYVESLQVNLALLRRKIKSSELKFEKLIVGRYTKTDVVIAYINGLADPEIVKEVKRRIQKIDIDGILESNYLEELIDDNPYSIFPTIKHTERPDTTAGLLLEGRVAVFVDGTPFVLSMPNLFTSYMQSPEDYYERYYISSFIRLLRFMALNISLLLPAAYIAVTTFHPEMLPTVLLLSLAGQREGVPFPALIEVLLMEIIFEILREAGVRLPKAVGQTVSIVGALVIGEAAVSAGIVSPAMVIIVALTGIANFVMPAYNAAGAVRLLRFLMIILASVLGLFGVMFGLMLVQGHLASLRTFGVPYLSPIAPISIEDQKDVWIRGPWWTMQIRPRFFNNLNQKRQKVKRKDK